MKKEDFIFSILGGSIMSYIGALLVIFFIVFILGPITYGIWVPIRLHYTGTSKIEVVDTIYYYPGAFSVYVDVPERYEMKTRINPGYDYLCSDQYIKNLSTGDTIYVFSSHIVKCGFCLASDEKHYKPKTIFHTLFRFSLFFSFFGIIILMIMFKVGLHFSSLSLAAIQKDLLDKSKQKNLTRALKISSYLSFSSFVSCGMLIGIITLKASFAVEQTHVFLTGLVILIGGIFTVSAPKLAYLSKKHFDNPNPKIILSKNLITFLFGTYGTFKTVKFLMNEDLTKYNNLFEVIISLIKTFF